MTDTTSRHESDEVEWLSGLIDGQTTGTPIAFIVRNKDARSSDYDNLRHCYRPGHADYTYQQRYGLRDHRGGGRASGRETVARVVAGAIAKQLLHKQNVSIQATAHVPERRTADDTYGGVVECEIAGLPAGLGNPVFGKINALLAAAMMSIPSAIGFEMGSGFAAAGMTGREFVDPWNPADPSSLTQTNHCGGLQGGITNGMPVTFRVAFHPAATQLGATECLADDGTLQTIAITGRHDRCHVLRCPVIVESMAAITLLDVLLQK